MRRETGRNILRAPAHAGQSAGDGRRVYVFMPDSLPDLYWKWNLAFFLFFNQSGQIGFQNKYNYFLNNSAKKTFLHEMARIWHMGLEDARCGKTGQQMFL